MSEHAAKAVRRLLAATGSGELEGLCTRRRIELLVLFGSAAGSAYEAHDVDLALTFEREAPHDLIQVLDDLYALTGYEGYDLLDLGRAGPLARERALVRGRLLYQARPGQFANTQIAAIMERLDTDEMRRVELELLSR